jgi:hypothetical protein
MPLVTSDSLPGNGARESADQKQKSEPRPEGTLECISMRFLNFLDLKRSDFVTIATLFW